MKVAFVDTLYFVALFNPRDQWHERAIAASKLVAETKLITTEDVLVELLNFFSEYGEKARLGAVTQAGNSQRREYRSGATEPRNIYSGSHPVQSTAR